MNFLPALATRCYKSSVTSIWLAANGANPKNIIILQHNTLIVLLHSYICNSFHPNFGTKSNFGDVHVILHAIKS